MAFKPMTKSLLIKWLISFAVAIVFLLIPVSGMFTLELKKFFVVTLFSVMLMLFELLPAGVIGLFLMTAYSGVGLVKLNDAMGQMGSSTIVPMMLCWLMLDIISNTNLLKRVAYKLMYACGGSYLGILFGMALLGVICTIIVPSLTISVMVYSIGLGLLRALNIPAKSNIAVTVMWTGCGAVMFAQHWLYTVTGLGYAINNIATVVEGFSLPSATITLQNLPGCLEFFVIVFIISKVFKPEGDLAKGKDYFKEQLEALGKIGKDEIKVAVCLILLVIFMLTNGIHGLAIHYGFFGFCILMYVPGIKIGKPENFSAIRLNPLFLVAACLLIGTAGVAAGLPALVNTLLGPIMVGTNPFIFTAACWLTGFIANFVMTPGAFLGTLSAPLASIAVTAGYNPAVVAYTLNRSGNAVLFPYENGGYISMFGWGMMSMKQFIKAAAIATAVDAVFSIVIMPLYWTIIGIM